MGQCSECATIPLGAHGRGPVLQPSVPSCSCFRLTAFVLKSFAQARSFIFIDPRELAAAKGWIIRQQRADGSFPAVGRILNKDIQVNITASPAASRASFGALALPRLLLVLLGAVWWGPSPLALGEA